MTFDWQYYLELSYWLKDEGLGEREDLEEAIQRSIISRAYYAAFSHTKSYMEEKGENFGSNSHKEVIKRLENKSKFNRDDINGRTVASALKEIKPYREDADYESNITGVERKIEHTIRRSEKIQKEIDGWV